MKSYLSKVIPGIRGIYEFIFSIYSLPRFLKERAQFITSGSGKERFPLRWSDTHLTLLDATKRTPFDPHYIYHPAWAARILAETRPSHHVDIASILTFPTIVSAFIPVTYYDYRPAPLTLRNLQSLPGDLYRLPFADNSQESLSCMHTIEHVGMGRYGEPIDYDGDIKACRELSRTLKPGGNLLFVTPVGRARIAYNAHRIYSYEQVLSLFPDLQVKEFSLVPDNYKELGFLSPADPSLIAHQKYGCGCFWFTKV